MRIVCQGNALVRAFVFVVAGTAAAAAFAQTPAAPISAPAASPTQIGPSPISVANGVQLQTETVQINDFAAYPSTITRTSGPFILHLVNRTLLAPPALTWSLATGPQAALTSLAASVDLTAFANLKRQLSVINLTAGQYLLKNAAGKVLLTLTIQ